MPHGLFCMPDRTVRGAGHLKITGDFIDFFQSCISVVVPEGPTPQALMSFIQNGGVVLIAGTTHPGLDLNKTVKLWEDTRSSYMRIEDHSILPSLRDTWVLFWEGKYLELEPSPTPVTLLPPGQFGPPDKVATLDKKTNKPGLILKDAGNGKIAFIPWHIGQLYYQHSNDKHRMFISDLLDYLLPDGRQLKTNAHPAVEITLMKQPRNNFTFIHLVNLIGHSGTAFFDAVEMKNISIQVKGEFRKAFIVNEQQTIPIERAMGYSSFTVPILKEYTLVRLDE